MNQEPTKTVFKVIVLHLKLNPFKTETNQITIKSEKAYPPDVDDPYFLFEKLSDETKEKLSIDCKVLMIPTCNVTASYQLEDIIDER